METGGVTGSSNQESNSSTQKQSLDVLGKDDFFKLLITELKYQNPLEPMKDREFISQMANFSSLEQMQNMNKNLENFTSSLEVLTTIFTHSTYMQEAVSLIGKEIEFAVGDQTQNGVVESVLMQDGVPLLMVEGKKVNLGQLLVIKLPESPELNQPDTTDSIA